MRRGKPTFEADEKLRHSRYQQPEITNTNFHRRQAVMVTTRGISNFPLPTSSDKREKKDDEERICTKAKHRIKQPREKPLQAV